MSKLRILLADDHEAVREGLKAILNAQVDMEIVGEVADGRAAVDEAIRLSPDLVVMDVSMPVLNGLKATEHIGQCCPRVRVLALTRHADGGFVQQLLRAGVSGYVLKQSRTAELLHAIRAVAGGGTYLDPSVAGSAVGRMRPQQTRHGIGARDISAREEEVLKLVAWGYSNKEIATRLELSVKTVETHKANVSHKLMLNSRIDIVRYALLQGWLRDL